MTAVYTNAVQQLKQKMNDDINDYLGRHDELPALEQYLADRTQFIDSLWLNIWLNRAKNSVSKTDKTAFLTERGYETENIKRKLLNQLFEHEIRNYPSFDAVQWLQKKYSDDQPAWQQTYETARKKYIQQEKKRKLLRKVTEAFSQMSDYQKTLIYLSIRYHTALKLSQIFAGSDKYLSAPNGELHAVGKLSAEDYFSAADLFTEYTGNVLYIDHRHRYIEYETFRAVIEPLIYAETYNTAMTSFFGQLNDTFFQQYAELYEEELTRDALAEIVADDVNDLVDSYLAVMEEEIVADLLELAKKPFDEATHLELYTKSVSAREQRKNDRALEIAKKQEQEARILEDIFGREYSPPPGRNIHYVLHIGDTNTGKTHRALQRMKAGASGLYLAPLRLLALEVYDKLNDDGIPCSLKTGEEEKETPGAQHISSTVEMFSEKEFYDVIVIDEAQMIADKDRGFSWYKAMTKANAGEVHIIGSKNSLGMISQLLGDSRITIRTYERETPLQVEKKPFQLKQTKKGDALVCFSRKRVLETAAALENDGYRASMIYGSMPPETRKKQIHQFINGETTVIVATDAIGMGLNLPIRRIVFLENEKFDGTRRRYLTSQEVKQIAGRAGRKGIYDIGKVAFTKDIKRMKTLLRQDDFPVQTFAVAPTNTIFERFQKYYRDLGTFFELWEKFKSPKGTRKASLQEERELYEMIRGTEIDARLPMMELYGFLHLPFSKKESALIDQWRETMIAVAQGKQLPEPKVTGSSLEELELSYKAVGLHLLFLYRLGKKTEAIYWERLRQEISDAVHEALNNDVKTFTKKCNRCGTALAYNFRYPVCNRCFAAREKRRSLFYSR